MPFPRSATVAATAALALCAGCVQQPSPSPLPQATPTYSCTPVTGGTPYPCYENQYQETSAQNALYEQAEAVVRKFSAEDERIYRLGGIASSTPVIEETLTGPLLKSTMENYMDLKKEGTRMTAGHFEIASIERLGEVKNGSIAALKVCSDVSDVQMRTGQKKPYRLGLDLTNTFYFYRVDSSLKMGDATYEWIKAC
jgi:hypothetical protein